MGKSMTGARACARDKVRSPRRQGAHARTNAPPRGRRRRLGRGASGHAPAEPSGAERGRALPSAAESSRVERPGVGWCSCVPAAQQSAAPASPPLPQRGLRRPAGHPPGGRPGARGERPSYGRRRRSCQVSARCGPSAPRVPPRLSVPVSVCPSACQPPVFVRAASRQRLTPGPARSVRQPLPPAAPGLSVSRQHPHAGRLRPFPPRPRLPPICHHPRPQLQARASWGREVPPILGVSVAITGHTAAKGATRGLWRGSGGGPQMPARPCEGACPRVRRVGKRGVCAREPGGERGGRADRRGAEMLGGQSHLLQLRGPLRPAEMGQPLPVV